MKTKMTAAVVVGAMVSMVLAGCGGIAMKDMKGQGGMDSYNLNEGKITPNPKLVIDTKVSKNDLNTLSHIRNGFTGGGKSYGGSIATLVDSDNQIMSTFIPMCFVGKKQLMPASRGGLRSQPHGAIHEVDGLMYGIHYIFDAKTGLLITDSGISNEARHSKQTIQIFAHDGEPITVSAELSKRSGGKLPAGVILPENTSDLYFTSADACVQASEFNINSGSTKYDQNRIENLYRVDVLSVNPDNQKVITEFMTSSVNKSSDENYRKFISSVLPILNSEGTKKKAAKADKKLQKSLDSEDGGAGDDAMWAEVDDVLSSSVANPNVSILRNSSGQAIAKRFDAFDKASAKTNSDGTTLWADGWSMKYLMYKLPMILRTDEIKNAIKGGMTRGQ